MNCPRCGHAAAETDRFCSSCGAALGAPAETVTDAPAPHAAEPELPAPAPPVPAPPHYAGFWRRLVAMTVDALLLFFPQAILRVLLGLSILSYDDQWDDSRVVTAECVSFGIALLYATLLECSAAQGTLGQQLLGLRVTSMQGERIGFGRSLGRQLAKFISVVVCLFGYALQLWNGKRQTLHDMIAGCLVVRAGESRADGVTSVS